MYNNPVQAHNNKTLTRTLDVHFPFRYQNAIKSSISTTIITVITWDDFLLLIRAWPDSKNSFSTRTSISTELQKEDKFEHSRLKMNQRNSRH